MSFVEGLRSLFSDGNSEKSSDWHTLTEKAALDQVLEESFEKPQLLFKHSTRCSVSLFARLELEKYRQEIEKHAGMHLIDVIASRDVSRYAADKLDIAHESPQAILIAGGEVVWHDSHGSVKGETILEVLDQ